MISRIAEEAINREMERRPIFSAGNGANNMRQNSVSRAVYGALYNTAPGAMEVADILGKRTFDDVKFVEVATANHRDYDLAAELFMRYQDLPPMLVNRVRLETSSVVPDSMSAYTVHALSSMTMKAVGINPEITLRGVWSKISADLNNPEDEHGNNLNPGAVTSEMFADVDLVDGAVYGSAVNISHILTQAFSKQFNWSLAEESQSPLVKRWLAE